MREFRAALAILLAFSTPGHAETTSDPLWHLLSTYVLAPDASAIRAEGEQAGDAKGLAALQADLMLLSEGFEAFRDEAQVKESLARLEPRMSPELKPFFKDRDSSLDAVYRTLAVADYTWAKRFADPPCAPAEARRKLLDGRDGLFRTADGLASPWLEALLGPRAAGKSAEQALDQASSHAKMSGSDYARRRALVRRLTLALAGAEGTARAELYCSRAAIFEELAADHRSAEGGAILASRAVARTAPEASVFAVVSGSRRAAATFIDTKAGPVLLTDASVARDGDRPRLFAFTPGAKPAELATSVTRRDEGLGLAVLSYAGDAPRLALADKAAAKDDFVTALGHAEVSGPWTKTSGLVTAANDSAFQTDAVVSVDFTGGPVLNEDGEVAGILTLRPARNEEGSWPMAVPASAISRWLDGEPVPASPEAAAVLNDGTAAVLSRARPGTLTQASLPDWEIGGLPPPPPEPHSVCVKYCDEPSAPSRSAPSRAAPSSSRASDGSAELGQALGNLGAVFILEGIPALFRGIASLFQSKPRPQAQPPQISQYTPPAAREAARGEERPKDPEKAACTLKPAGMPKKIGGETVELKVRLECAGVEEAELAGRTISFSLGWSGKPAKYQAEKAITDAQGYASIFFRVDAGEAPKEGGGPDPAPPAVPAPLLSSRDTGPVDAAAPQPARNDAKTEKPTLALLTTAVGTSPVIRSIARFSGGKVRGSTGLVLIGATVAVELAYEYLKSAPKPVDCEALNESGDTLARFIDGSRLGPGFLDAHEGETKGHTKSEHLRDIDHLKTRFKETDTPSAYDDQPTAERVIKEAIEKNIPRIEFWIAKTKLAGLNPVIFDVRTNQPSVGFGITETDDTPRRKTDVLVVLRRYEDCRILILTSYPK